jgi:SAM-dependent methyltransferase
MQLTPALTKLCGYQSVAGAYLGPKGQTVRKQATIGGEVVLTCEVDLFDAERDPFPHADGQFKLVLTCEIIEHLRRDPMHLLLEARRVLEAEGLLLLTTPNCSSATAITRVLCGDRNPYTFSSYPRPNSRDTEHAPLHIREYTVAEISELLDAAGFAVEVLFTERIADFPETNWVEDILKAHRLPTDLRGEQTCCLARKRPDATIRRYPEFLYTE